MGNIGVGPKAGKGVLGGLGSLSVRVKITLLVLLLVVPIVLLGIAGTLYYQGVIRQNIGEDNLNSAKTVAAMTPEYLNSSELYLKSIADRPLVVKAMEEDNRTFLQEMAAYTDETARVNGVYFTDSSGKVIAGTPQYADAIGRSAGDRAYVRDVLGTGKAEIGDGEQGPNQTAVIPIGTPIASENGTVLGVLVGAVDMDEFSKVVQGTVVNDRQYTYLVNRSGHILMHNNPALAASMADFGTVPVVQRALGGEAGVQESYNPVENQTRLAAYAPVEPLGWAVVVALPVDVAYQPVWNATWLAAGIIAAFTVAVLGLGLYVGDGIARPIEDLSRATRRMDDTDDYRQLLPLDRADEVGELARSFDEMVGTIRRENAESEQALKALGESKAKLEAVIQSMSDAVFVSDAGGNFVEFNEAFATFHKFRNKEECYKTLAEYPDYIDVYFADGTLAPLDMWAVPRALRGETVANAEYVLRRKDTGERWWGSYSFGPIRDKEGKIVGSVVVGRDVTESRHREERIARLTGLYKTLSRVNETIVRVHDEKHLFEEVCKIVSEDGGFPLVWIGEVNGRQVDPASLCGPAAGYLSEIRVEVDGPLGMGPTGTCIREGRAVINNEFGTNPSTLPWRETALKRGFHSSAAFPIFKYGKVFGAFTLYSGEPGAFDAEQLRLLQALSADISYAVEALDHERQHLLAVESLRRLSRAVEESPATVVITDITGAIEYVNPKFTRTTGYTLAEVRGKNPRVLKTGKTTQEEYKVLWDTILSGKEWRGEFLNRKKTGELYWEAAMIAPITDAQGKITSFVAVKEDITDRKLAETEKENLLVQLKAKTAELESVNEELEVKGEELAAQAEEIECANEELRTNNEELRKVTASLREAQDYLESLINYANAPIIVWDPTFKITRFNRAFERLSGYTAGEAIGRDLSLLFPSESRAEALAKIKKTLEGEQWESVEIPILHKYGSIRIALWNSANISGADGALLATIAQGQDITIRKAAEKALEEAKQQAELYLDLMGHDISNMHQIALGQLELAHEVMVEDGRLESEEIELIDTPIESLRRSARIIDNVRKLQELKAEGHSLELIDLSAVLADVVRSYSGIPGRDITLNYSPGGGECPVRANPLLKDVFGNLVDNAIKHSGDPVVLGIGVSRVSLKNTSYYRVAIEDNGGGIPDDRKEEVFHRFKRGQTKAKGTGLGLYIVKTLVEGFGGHVEIQNRVLEDYTKGTRFLVYLPAAGGEKKTSG